MLSVDKAKIGMKVRVKTNIHRLTDNANCGYVPEIMKDMEGKGCVISEFRDKDSPYFVVRLNKGNEWYSCEWLEPDNYFENDLFKI